MWLRLTRLDWLHILLWMAAFASTLEARLIVLWAQGWRSLPWWIGPLTAWDLLCFAFLLAAAFDRGRRP